MKRKLLLFCAGLATLATACDSLRARQAANEGATLYKKGDLKGAAEKYEEASRLDPKLPAVALNLGFTYLSIYQNSPKSKDGAEAGGHAAEAFEKYITLKPEDKRGRDYLLQTFVDTGRYDDAVKYFQPEVERASPSLDAIRTLGVIAAKTGRLDDALKWYQRRCDLAPSDPDGHYNLGVLIWDHLHNHLEVVGDARAALADRGLAALQKSIDLRPHAPEGYTYMNLLYRERARAWLPSLPMDEQAALAANPCGTPPTPDPNAPPPAPTPGKPAPPPLDDAAKKAIADAEAKRVADCASADKFQKEAMDKIKAQGGLKPPATENK